MRSAKYSDNFGKDHLGPALEEVGKRLHEVNERHRILPRVGEHVEKIVKENPERVGLFGVSLVAAIASIVVTAPLYMLMGMSGAGPIAGK